MAQNKKGPRNVTTSVGVAKINKNWIASTKTPVFALARPTAQIASSSPLYSGHWPSLIKKKNIFNAQLRLKLKIKIMIN